MTDARVNEAGPGHGVSPAGVVLVADDEHENRALFLRLLGVEGYEVHTVGDGVSALAAIERHRPDVILLDVQMPGLDGFEVCRQVKQNPATRLTPVVIVTGLNERHNRIKGINAGADDFIVKPFDTEELRARVRSLIKLKHYTDDLESAESVIMSLALTVEARDAYTEGHCQRLAAYATTLGEALRLSTGDLAALYRGGYLHDVGKIGIPDALLLKPAQLTPAEFDIIRQHTVIGERLCGKLRSLGPVRSIVRHHHERLDGSGYPDGLRGDAVPLLAQIVGIVDVYDAVTTTRPYRAAGPPERGYEELLLDVAGGARRRDLVDTFIALGRAGGLAGRDDASVSDATLPVALRMA